MSTLIAGKKSEEMINYLANRRSVKVRHLVEPGPSQTEIEKMIEIAARVPDHGKLSPFQFAIIEGNDRERIGQEILREAYLLEKENASEAKLDLEAGRFMQSPLVIGVIFSPKPGKIPLWEQKLCAGAACQNLILAANALGYGAQWLTEWYSFNDKVKMGFGLKDGEEFAGFIYIGTVEEAPEERKRPQVSDLIKKI